MDAGKLRRFFIAAIDLGPEDRSALLREADLSESERDTLLELLAHDSAEGSDPLLEQPISELRKQIVSGRFGPYELQDLIGSGGMGSVYKAHRADGEVNQVVAVKVLNREWLDPKIVSRFRRERQILAGLAHPNIARLLDTGTRDDGRPYLVMEYVEGERLDEYCGNRQPGVREVLRLFVMVCRGIAYAHSKLVIHRDLKPSNILVTAEGVPKILDFGIARALDSVDVHTTETLLLTPHYASPDQARGEAPSTATDVYGLGAVLYFLLTGAPPHQVSGLSAMEVVRHLCEREPAPPSSLRPELKGDLENIVQKAMHSQPERRYGSARELADDVERYLSMRPVLASPDHVSYRLARFVARRRWLVSAVAAASLAVTVATGYAWRERQRATEEAAISKAVSEFLQHDLISQAGLRSQLERGVKADPDLKVRTLLDRAAQSVSEKFNQMPNVEAAVRVAIGGAYGDLGLDDEARKQYQRALEIRQAVSGRTSAESLNTANLLAETLSNVGKRKEADTIYQQIAVSAGGSREGRRAAAHARYGSAMIAAADKRHEALPLLEKAIDGLRSIEGSENPSVLTALNQLAVLHLEKGDPAKAESLFRETLQARTRVLGPSHPDTLGSMSELGVFCYRRARFKEAEELLRKSADGMESVLGSAHPVTLNTLNNLTNVYSRYGQYAQAEPIFMRILEGERKLRGPDHPDTLTAAHNLAVNYQLSGKYAAAAKLQEDSLTIKRSALGAEHPLTLAGMRSLASAYRETGRLAESARVAADALAIGRRVMGVHLDTAYALNELARTRKAQARFDEAEPLFREALAMRIKLAGPTVQSTLVTKNDLAGLLQATGRYAEAESLFSETLAARRKLFGENHPSTLNSMSDLAALNAMQGRLSDAALLQQKVVTARREALGADHPNTLRAMRELASVHRRQGQFDEARKLLVTVQGIVTAMANRGETVRGLAVADLNREVNSLPRQNEVAARTR